MPNDVAHFAIHADDCLRAKAFYEAVFDWSFEAWGPPDFWLIETSKTGIQGALQKRREPLTGTGTNRFECTVSVDELEPILAAVQAHGGRVTMPAMQIETVGTLTMIEDPEGNVLGVMRYEEGARR